MAVMRLVCGRSSAQAGNQVIHCRDNDWVAHWPEGREESRFAYPFLACQEYSRRRARQNKSKAKEYPRPRPGVNVLHANAGVIEFSYLGRSRRRNVCVYVRLGKYTEHVFHILAPASRRH